MADDNKRSPSVAAEATISTTPAVAAFIKVTASDKSTAVEKFTVIPFIVAPAWFAIVAPLKSRLTLIDVSAVATTLCSDVKRLIAAALSVAEADVESPIRTIVANAGGEGSVVVAKVSEGKKDFGYDAKKEEYVDMLKAGIIDPKKVTRIALENAASVAGMILTTECALVDIKEESAAAPMPPMGGGMPGMM